MGQDERSPSEELLRMGAHHGGKKLAWWALSAGGASILGTLLILIIAAVGALSLLAGIGAWFQHLFGPHPPAIATTASRPAEWLPIVTDNELGLPNAVVLAVMEQASDGQAYGDRYYCSDGRSAGEKCSQAYHPGLLGIGPKGVHTIGIGYGLMGIDSKSGLIPKNQNPHSVAWNVKTGTQALRHALFQGYWKTDFPAFHHTVQTPPGWKNQSNYDTTMKHWLGTYQIVDTNGKPGPRTNIQKGVFVAGPHLGAWAIALWSHKTGQFEDPGNQPEWVLAVGLAPTGPRWSHLWKPHTTRVIPPPPHSKGKPTVLVTHYYLYGHTLTRPVSVTGILANGQHVSFGWSGNDKKIPMWPGGSAFGAKVALTGPKRLTKITALWSAPQGVVRDTINWPEQSTGAPGTVIHVPPTQAVKLWWKDILIASQKTGVPADWIAAEMLNESGGNPSAGNPAGAYGLMQLEPATAAGLPGYTPGARHNPLENLILGAELLAALHGQWGSWRISSAAYYGGSGRVQRSGVGAGMPWSQASGLLNWIPAPGAGNSLTMTAYANNIEATSQVVSAMKNK